MSDADADDLTRADIPGAPGPDDDDDLLHDDRASSDLSEGSEEQVPKASPKAPVLGDYVLLGRIGAGGMGRVFKAQHRRMERLVALKMLPSSVMRDTSAVKRFHHEVKAAAKLFHPNIVTAFDAGEQNGIHYLVMEYIEGQPLSNLVRQHGPLPVDKAALYTLHAAQGLQYAHSREVVHRDIKPSNLILDIEGRVKILDMGTARYDGAQGAGELTQSGVIMGTVTYMSPEQARAAAEVDHRTDIYSLGCTLHFLLTGKPIFQGDMIQTLLAHAQEPIPRLSAARVDVPDWLEQVFQRMVAKRPEDRFATMADVIAALEAGPGAAAAGDAEPSRLAGLAAIAGLTVGPSRTLPALGIDLGTTYCRVAYLNAEGTPVTLLDGEGQPATPAAVMLDGVNLEIGQRALTALDQHSERVALDVKRTVGQHLYPKELGETRYPPEVLLGLLLAKVRDDARHRIGDFRHVVISVPAYFDEVRRTSIQNAGYIGGLEVLDIINEPMASAVAHAFEHDFLKPPGKGNEPVKVLAIDFGGGGFDVTLMDDHGDRFVELASGGDLTLGGRDWDNRLVDLMARQCLEATGQDPRQDPVVSGRLWIQAEKAKRLLTDHAHVNIEFRLSRETTSVRLGRAQFREATTDLLNRLAPILDEVVETGGCGWSGVDRVMLCGGSARMPMFGQLIKRLSGRKIHVIRSPEDGVAHGAALYAAAKVTMARGGTPPFEISSVNAHSLGVVGIDSRTRKRCNAILIPRNSPLPATTQRNFKTQKQGQDSVMVQIIQGESHSPDQCMPVGKCVIGNLPANLPAGSPVNVEFQYAANGRLSVFVESKATGYRATKEINRAVGLSNVELTRWREWVETMMLCGNFW